MRDHRLDGRTFDDFMMPPCFSVVEHRKDVSTTVQFAGVTLDLPILSANMDTITERDMAVAVGRGGGMGIIHRAQERNAQGDVVQDVVREGVKVGAAIGATDDFIMRASTMLGCGASCLVMDVAHAHSKVVAQAVRRFRNLFGQTKLIVGNVATYDGASFLLDLGVDGIKVGVGAGSVCRTRLETGYGVGQLQAIRECYRAVGGAIPIIADGGIRHDKDIFMSLAAGADAVMLGGMLAGCDECPAVSSYRTYRGMTAMDEVPEGVSIHVAYRGPVAKVLSRIKGHLQSAISYSGCESLTDVRSTITPAFEEYIRPISAATYRESYVR